MSKELTRWFPPNTKPARIGIYNASVARDAKVFRHWDGERWGIAGRSIEKANAARPATTDCLFIFWRGLSFDPSTKENKK